MRILEKARNEEGEDKEWNKGKKIEKSNFKVKSSLTFSIP